MVKTWIDPVAAFFKQGVLFSPGVLSVHDCSANVRSIDQDQQDMTTGQATCVQLYNERETYYHLSYDHTSYFNGIATHFPCKTKEGYHQDKLRSPGSTSASKWPWNKALRQPGVSRSDSWVWCLVGPSLYQHALCSLTIIVHSVYCSRLYQKPWDLYPHRQTSSANRNAVSCGTSQQGILLPVSEMSQYRDCTGSKHPAEIQLITVYRSLRHGPIGDKIELRCCASRGLCQIPIHSILCVTFRCRETHISKMNFPVLLVWSGGEAHMSLAAIDDDTSRSSSASLISSSSRSSASRRARLGSSTACRSRLGTSSACRSRLAAGSSSACLRASAFCVRRRKTAVSVPPLSLAAAACGLYDLWAQRMAVQSRYRDAP